MVVSPLRSYSTYLERQATLVTPPRRMHPMHLSNGRNGSNPREKWRQPLHTASTLRVLQLGTLCDRSSVHQPSVRQLRMNTQAGTYVNSSDWDLRSIRRITNTAVDIHHSPVPPMLRRPRRRGITIESPFLGGACWSASLADTRRCQRLDNFGTRHAE